MHIKKYERFFQITFCIVLPLIGVLGFLYSPSRIQKRLLEKEKIYEISITYSVVQDTGEAFFMVCDPPSSAEERSTLIYRFLTGDKIEDIYTRSLDFVHLLGRPDPQNGVKLFFVEPSKDLGVGVFPKEGESIYDYRPEGHIIAEATLENRELSQVEIY